MSAVNLQGVCTTQTQGVPPKFRTELATTIEVIHKEANQRMFIPVVGEEFGSAQDTHFFKLFSPLKPKKELGQILLEIKSRTISIFYMYSENFYRSNTNPRAQKKYENVGKALHEIAVRFSYHSGKNGHVELLPIFDVCGFHFKAGFRFENPEPMVNPNILKLFSIALLRSYNVECDAYLHMKQNEAKSNLADRIKGNAIYESIEEEAAQELGKPPSDIDEVLEFGRHVLWDANDLMDRFYNKPTSNSKAQICNPANKRFEFEGKMILTDKVREYWQKVIGMQKP